MRNPMIGLISNRYLKDKYVLIEKMNYCVYFISDGEFVKIGMAASLPNRIKQLQTGNPRELHALYVIDSESQREASKIESELHSLLRNKQCMGEWFNIKEGDIRKSCAKLGYKLRIPISKFDFGVSGIQII